MKTKVVAIAIVGLGAFVAPVSAQIIATSIPRTDSGGGKAAGQKKFAFHILVAPLSKWKYGEVYILGNPDSYDNGIVNSNPNSKVLLAGEASFALGTKWSLGLGGWWNKIGSTTYHFDGTERFFGFSDSVTFDTPGDTKMYEGHLNLFYKDFGIQVGVIRTNGKIGGSISKLVFGGGESFPGTFDFDQFDATTTDKDIFAVYRKSGGTKTPWGASIGAGVYRKQGVPSDSPLRLPNAQNVFTAFVTANIGIYKGLGIDASYWYIGKTKATNVELEDVSLMSFPSPSQSRITLGLGYTFSR